jgi:epoxide hydrolase-like predicted phosphatase
VAVQLGELDLPSLWAYVLGELGLPPEELTDVQDGFWGGDRVDYDLVDFIRSLRPRCKTGVISNGWPTLRRTMTDEWQIIDAFDDLVVSAEVGLLKPAPDIYQLALQRLDVGPAEAVFVDDFSENVEAARDLGMYAVHFHSRNQAIAELQALMGERTI